MTGSDSAIRPMGLYGAAVFLLVLLFFAGLMAGSRWVSPTSLLSAIDGSSDLLTRITVLELRLPRNLLGILGGAALGVGGMPQELRAMAAYTAAKRAWEAHATAESESDGGASESDDESGDEVAAGPPRSKRRRVEEVDPFLACGL